MIIPALLISFFLSGCSSSEKKKFVLSNRDFKFVVPSYQDVEKRIDSIFPGFKKNEEIFESIKRMLEKDKSIQKKKEVTKCKIDKISRQNQKNQQTKKKIEKLKYFSFLKKEILTHIISLIDYSYNLEVKKVEKEGKKMAESQLSAVQERLITGEITITDVAFLKSEVANMETKIGFAKLALSENKIKIEGEDNLDFIFDLINDNNVSKVEKLKEIFFKSNTELYIKKLEVEVEEKCNKKEKEYNLEKFEIEGLNKIKNIKNKIKTYQELKKSNQVEIETLKIYVEGVLNELEFGTRTTIDVFNSMNSLQNAKLKSIKIKAEILKSYYQLVFLTI